MRSRNGSSGLRLSLSEFASSLPAASGQKFLGTTPLGLNITTSRFFRACWLANPRLGRFMMNGKAAAPIPRSRMNSRRVRFWATVVLRKKG